VYTVEDITADTVAYTAVDTVVYTAAFVHGRVCTRPSTQPVNMAEYTVVYASIRPCAGRVHVDRAVYTAV